MVAKKKGNKEIICFVWLYLQTNICEFRIILLDHHYIYALNSGIATGRSRGRRAPNSEKFAKNWEKSGKRRGKSGKRLKIGKKMQGSFTLPPPQQIGLATPLALTVEVS